MTKVGGVEERPRAKRALAAIGPGLLVAAAGIGGLRTVSARMR